MDVTSICEECVRLDDCGSHYKGRPGLGCDNFQRVKTSPWKPQAGVDCIISIGQHRQCKFVGASPFDATEGIVECRDGAVFRVKTALLRPVPLEPPVKVGDVLQVTVDRRTYYGRVESICWPAFTLQWCVGDGNGHTKVLPFSPNTTITKLTAAPEAKP